ncbi:MAG: hypothetical protein PHR78_08060 [Eubacteriales bacterium]|nr:hypothetical protein [Eubacteriales bacterium]MDD4323727.1 hypothetical protein [Eubacteriales bacterium]MDD4542092.1 hypothetical protein [Eubacteriales bacterium]
MDRSSNNNNSFTEVNKAIPEHENQVYGPIPESHSAQLQPEKVDRATQRRRIFIPLGVLLFILLSILTICFLFADTISKLIG